MAAPSKHHPTRKTKRPQLGQHFLIDQSASAAVVNALGDLSGCTVLEIGPGGGALTRLLRARSKHLVAVEIDPSLAGALAQEFAQESAEDLSPAENSWFELLRQDILSVSLTGLANRFGCPLVVVGNLPYYITSDILLHLFEHSAAIDRAVLMMQLEVADKIVAPPGGREYGLLSATTQMHARGERLFALSPRAFSPPPKVNSAVVRLKMHPRFEELRVPRKGFLVFLQKLFAQKRKTLANNLLVAGYPAAAVGPAMAACGAEPMVRAEALPLPIMACLFRELHPRSDDLRLPSE